MNAHSTTVSRLPLLLLLLTVAALALSTDVTGKWTGTVEVKTPDGEVHTQPAVLVLKQEGDKITGQGGPSDTELHDLAACKLDSEVLECEVRSDEVLKLRLVVSGDSMDGELTAGGESKDAPARTAKVKLQREKKQ